MSKWRDRKKERTASQLEEHFLRPLESAISESPNRKKPLICAGCQKPIEGKAWFFFSQSQNKFAHDQCMGTLESPRRVNYRLDRITASALAKLRTLYESGIEGGSEGGWMYFVRFINTIDQIWLKAPILFAMPDDIL